MNLRPPYGSLQRRPLALRALADNDVVSTRTLTFPALRQTYGPPNLSRAPTTHAFELRSCPPNEIRVIAYASRTDTEKRGSALKRNRALWAPFLRCSSASRNTNAASS